MKILQGYNMPVLRKITNEPIDGFVLDRNNPIRDGLALMIQNGYAYPDKDGDKPLRDKDGDIVIAGKQYWEEKGAWLKEKCEPFINHLQLIMNRDPRDVDVFLDYMAFKQQYAGVKPRWAIVLAGEQGVGKDVSIEACWEEYGINFINNVSPTDIMSPYNDFVQCMLLRISEAADLLEGNRWTFNERLKVLIAGHPDNMLINKKYGFKYWCTLYCGVILTTNHLSGGLYIPKGDRRMYVINCATMQEIGLTRIKDREEYFDRLFRWFKEPDENGINGYQYIGNYLFWGRNVENFNAGICPEPTQAKIDAMEDSDSIPDWLDNCLMRYQDTIDEKKNIFLDSCKDIDFSEIGDINLILNADKDGYPKVFCLRKLKEMGESNGVSEVRRGLDNYLKRAGYEKLRCKTNKEGKWRFKAENRQVKEIFYVRSKLSKEAALVGDLLIMSFEQYWMSYIRSDDGGF